MSKSWLHSTHSSASSSSLSSSSPSSIVKILKSLVNNKHRHRSQPTKKRENFKSIIEKVDVKIIKILAEIALNIHKRRLGVSKLLKKGLQHFNDLLVKFGCCYNSHNRTRSDIEKNRKVLLEHKSSRGSGLLQFVRFLIRAAYKILPEIAAKI